MGKASRDKGAREEAAVVNWFKSLGVSDARRVPLSGASEGFPGDIQVKGMIGEAKVKKGGDGFGLLYRWLGDHDFLTVRKDRGERLFVIPERTMAAMIRWMGWPDR